jgi:hypothetical protein
MQLVLYNEIGMVPIVKEETNLETDIRMLKFSFFLF